MERTDIATHDMASAAHMLTTHSKGMSAVQLQDQLYVTYKTAWLMPQKLRRSMLDADSEPWEGVVGSFATSTSSITRTIFMGGSSISPEPPENVSPALVNLRAIKLSLNRVGRVKGNPTTSVENEIVIA